jgi:hypothetical protein
MHPERPGLVGPLHGKDCRGTPDPQQPCLHQTPKWLQILAQQTDILLKLYFFKSRTRYHKTTGPTTGEPAGRERTVGARETTAVVDCSEKTASEPKNA